MGSGTGGTTASSSTRGTWRDTWTWCEISSTDSVKAGLPVNFANTCGVPPQQEWVGVVMDRLGVYAHHHRKYQLFLYSEIVTLLECTGTATHEKGYLRKKLSSVEAPTSDFIREKDTLVSMKSTNMRVPWESKQDREFAAVVNVLSFSYTLVLPNRKALFRLQTNANELEAGAALTQVITGSERWIGCERVTVGHTAMHAGRLPRKPDVIAVLWAVGHRRS